jgi:polyvinyl alcohol dehydrogenase (cytochrome)
MHKSIGKTLGPSLVAWACVTYAHATTPEQSAALYQERCAICHDNPTDYTPHKSTFSFRSAEFILQALTEGPMQPQAQGLDREQLQGIAVYVTGKAFNPNAKTLTDQWDINYCEHKPAALTNTDFEKPAKLWNGWGNSLEGKRFQAEPGITASDIGKLRIKWAFAYPGGRSNSQPVVIGDRLFVASRPGLVFSLDAHSGCTYWAMQVDSGARATVTVGPIAKQANKYAVYIGTSDRNVKALDIDTGATLWSTNVEQHPVAGITGSPLLVDDKLIVPVSSLEEAAARNEKYECCTFRGALVALDVRDGKILWLTHTIKAEPKPFKKNDVGIQMHGPAGAAIWSAPSYDSKRDLIYAATGDSYTDVVEEGSDSVIAVDIKTGNIVWQHQVTKGDNYLVGCINVRTHANCPEDMGPDYDFGSTPIIYNFTDANGTEKTLVLTGQKSGIIYAMDPDQDGKIIWQQQPGVGSVRGGIQWGSAIDDKNVYTAVSDSIAPPDNRRPGLSAYDLRTGELRWHTPAPKGECEQRGDRMTCTDAFSAAVSAMPGVVFASALNGWFGAFSSKDGKILWQQDMNKLQATSVNGLDVRGGSMEATGPVIVNGVVYVNSGYGGIEGQPGNVLFALSVDGE